MWLSTRAKLSMSSVQVFSISVVNSNQEVVFGLSNKFIVKSLCYQAVTLFQCDVLHIFDVSFEFFSLKTPVKPGKS